MENENTYTEQNNYVQSTPSQRNTITPLSKYLAIALFIILPFLGGWIGYEYAPEKIVEIEKVVEIEKIVKTKNITEPEQSTSTTKEFVDGGLGISFSYPNAWGEIYSYDMYGKCGNEVVGDEYGPYTFNQDEPCVMRVYSTGRITSGSNLNTDEFLVAKTSNFKRFAEGGIGTWLDLNSGILSRNLDRCVSNNDCPLVSNSSELQYRNVAGEYYVPEFNANINGYIQSNAYTIELTDSIFESVVVFDSQLTEQKKEQLNEVVIETLSVKR